MRRIGAASAVAALVAGSGFAPLGPAGATTSGTNGLIAFVKGTANCQDIYLLRADGGTTKLTKCPRLITAPAWSPDGKTLAVGYIPPSGNFNLKLALLKATGGTPTVVSTGVSPSNSPVFSRDGSVLAFAGGDAGDDNKAIYTVPLSGGTSTKLVGGANGEANDEPDWSPSADVIAWSRSTANSFDVWTMTVDATGHNPTALTNLTNGQGNSRYPSWSPDGTKIAFASNRKGSWQIYVMNADGSGVVQLTTGGNHIEPAWSPDGSKIAFVAGCTTVGCATTGPNGRRQDGNLQVVDVTDLSSPGTPQTLVGSTASEFDPQWAQMCSGTGCPVTAIRQRTVALTSIRRGVAKGRVIASGAPTGCRAGVPLVLQYENAIERGPEWHHNGHWIKEGSGRTTSTGRFHLRMPSRLTGWYRVKALQQKAGSTQCPAAASRLRANGFIRDAHADSRGPVDIAWAEARIASHVVSFTVHTAGSFATGQASRPCILFMKRVHGSNYGGSVGCSGGLVLNGVHKPTTTKRPDSRTIVYSFKELELGSGFTVVEWGVRSGANDHVFYDAAPNDFDLGNPNPDFNAWDTPYLFKKKPTYHR